MAYTVDFNVVSTVGVESSPVAAAPARGYGLPGREHPNGLRFLRERLSINVMYTVDGPQKRAVGFKLSAGMEVPAELPSRFKFARQKSKLAGTIRGSYFVIKNEY